jgi:hypothetical protein
MSEFVQSNRKTDMVLPEGIHLSATHPLLNTRKLLRLDEPSKTYLMRLAVES